MGQLLDNCQPIQDVQIRGRVTYSRVHSRIEGDELQAQNEKRKARGLNMLINSPYYILVIEDAQIVNPQRYPQEIVAYFNSKIKSYQNPDGTFTNRYYAMSKSKYAPLVAYSQDAGPALANGNEIKLRGELESGMDVTIGACIYKASIGKGVGFDYILLNEQIRYYNGAGAPAAITAALASQGIVYKNESVPEPESIEDTGVPYGEPVNNPAPYVAPAPARFQNPQAPVQQPQQSYPNPAPAPAPVPQQSYPNPAPVPPGMPVPNVQIPPQQAPIQQPQSGIQYNPLNYGGPIQ